MEDGESSDACVVASKTRRSRRECSKAPRRTKWTSVDLSRLACQHSLLGNKWTLLSKMFHKTDAQVKNIFHSIARSKSGLEKCAVLYIYARGIRGVEEDPEARRVALENAKASAIQMMDPNPSVKAGVTTAATANRPMSVTASPDDNTTPLAAELIDSHSETVTEADNNTNDEASSGSQGGNTLGATRFAVGEAAAMESTNAAVPNGCGCSTGQSTLRTEMFDPLYTSCGSARKTVLEALPQTIYASGSAMDVDCLTHSELDAAEELRHAREYDPRSDPLLLLRAHTTRTRAALQPRTSAPVPIGCTTAACPSTPADPDWRGKASPPGLQDAALEPSLGFSGRDSHVTLGGWDMEYMSPFVSLGFGPQAVELPGITHPVPVGARRQLPSYESSVTGAAGGCKGAEDVPCAPILGSGSASVLPPQLQHPQEVMPLLQWQPQPPQPLQQQQPGQAAAFDNDPFASLLADLLQEEPGNGVCVAGNGVAGVDGGEAGPVKAFTAPTAPVNGCNPYGMSGDSTGLWQLASTAGQCVAAPMHRCSSSLCNQSGGSWDPCAANAAAVTQLPSRHSAPAAILGHPWPLGANDIGYAAMSPAIPSASQAVRWPAAVPPAAPCYPASSLGTARATSGPLVPPAGLAAGLVPRATSCHLAAGGPAVPSGWDTGSGPCALWPRLGPGPQQPVAGPEPYVHAMTGGLMRGHGAVAASRAAWYAVGLSPASDAAFGMPVRPAVPRGSSAAEPACPLHPLLQGMSQAMWYGSQ